VHEEHTQPIAGADERRLYEPLQVVNGRALTLADLDASAAVEEDDDIAGGVRALGLVVRAAHALAESATERQRGRANRGDHARGPCVTSAAHDALARGVSDVSPNVDACSERRTARYGRGDLVLGSPWPISVPSAWPLL
jgi:hypothetical protein